MMTKPYAAGGDYINRMSTYCGDCRFTPERRMPGPDACPVTALYWDFVARHAERMAGNRRTRFAGSTWERMDGELQGAVKRRAGDARKELGL